MQDFFANCATVLQKYGFSYLRGAGTTLLLALVGTFFGCRSALRWALCRPSPLTSSVTPCGSAYC